MTDVPFRCTCGTVRGRLIAIGPGAGTRCACHCNSCRCAEIVLGQPDPWPQPVEIYQTTPDRVAIDSGADHLAVLRLTDKTRTYRWYCTCCDAPLAVTGGGPSLPFVSVHVGRIADPAALGPVLCQAFVPARGGGTRHTNAARFAYGLLSRAIAARISGRWKQTPFFDPGTGQPHGPVRILTKGERAALPLRG